MADDKKNPQQDITPTFVRKTPDGKTEKLDANGKPAGAKAPAPEGGDSAPTLKTGELPGNFVGGKKLPEAGITTYEAVREADEATLKSAGLDDEQIKKAQAAANKPE